MDHGSQLKGTQKGTGHLGRLDGGPPRLHRVAAANGGDLVYAEYADYVDEAWILHRVVRMRMLADGQVACERLESFAGARLGLDEGPKALYRRLLPRFTMTSSELIERSSVGDLAVVWGRWLRIILPAAMLITVLPMFVRFASRDRLVVAAVQAVAAGLWPAAVLVVGGIATEAARVPAVAATVAVVAAIGPGLVLWWRWRL